MQQTTTPPGQRPDYVVIGHITHDLQPDESVLFGGTAIFAAITAQRLGRQVAVATAGQLSTAPPSLDSSILFACQPDSRMTTFVNRYQDGQRTQFLLSAAAPIDLRALPLSWRQAPVIHLGPVAQEIAIADLNDLATPWLCATPQGWLRQWRSDGLVSLRPARRAAFAALPRVLVLSEGDEETNSGELIAGVRQQGGLVSITRGARGSTLYAGQERLEIPTFAVKEVDPTGAGDVYATALFIRLASGDSPAAAARYASAAGALSVTGLGTSAIPDDRSIRQLMVTSP